MRGGLSPVMAGQEREKESQGQFWSNSGKEMRYEDNKTEVPSSVQFDSTPV
jgi:hypothetical protein